MITLILPKRQLQQIGLPNTLTRKDFGVVQRLSFITDHIELLRMDPPYAKRWLNLLGYGKLVRDPSFNFRKHCAQVADRAKLEKANIKLTHDTIKAKIELDLQARNKRVSRITAEVQTAWDGEGSSTFQAPHEKEKTRTRTIASTQADDAVQAVPEISVSEEVDTTTTELQIEVDIRALSFFASIYSDADGGQDTGTLG
ncbi:hypothetical protein ACHAPG_009831 [Botrytis cinerea]